MEMDLDPSEKDKSERCCTLPELPQIPETAKVVFGLMFTACLNVMDLISDTWVVLQYGCLIGARLAAVPAVGSEACEAHPAWFGIGLSLLVVSNSLQSVIWVWGAVSVLRKPKTPLGSFATCPIALFVLAFLQFHYIVDIALVFHLGPPSLDDSKDARGFMMFLREFATKACERTPQLCFQAYILFAVGSHGDPVKLVSLGISVLALVHGTLSLRSDAKQKRLQNPVYYAMSFLWLASDQALRSASMALVLSQGARPYGLALISLASIAATSAMLCSVRVNHHFYNFSFFGLVAINFAGAYLVPFLPMFVLDGRDATCWLVLIIRWLETAGCALLAYLFAKTTCGYMPTSEVVGLTCLLGFNLICFHFLRLCCDAETGKLIPLRPLLQKLFRRPSRDSRLASLDNRNASFQDEDAAPQASAGAFEGNLQAREAEAGTLSLNTDAGKPKGGGDLDGVAVSTEDVVAAIEISADAMPFLPHETHKKRRKVKRKMQKGAVAEPSEFECVVIDSAETANVNLADSAAPPTRTQTGKKAKAAVKRKAKKKEPHGSAASSATAPAAVIGNPHGQEEPADNCLDGRPLQVVLGEE